MISDIAAPRVSGVSTSINTFRSELNDLKHQTVLIAPEYGATLTSSAAASQPAEFRIRARSVPRNAEDRLMRYSEILKLLPTLAKLDLHMVHVHTPCVAHYAGVRLARALGVPVVGTCHTHVEEYVHYVPLLPRSIGRRLAREMLVRQSRSLDGLIAPSSPMRDLLRGYGVDSHIEVIPTGIDMRNTGRGDGCAFRRRHNIRSDQPVLVHVARLSPEKNIDFILRVLSRVVVEIPDVLLVLAGEGPALTHLRGLSRSLGVERHCLFVGYLDPETTLADCYRGGNLFVYASRSETQGLVLLEALAHGLPVVSTAVMGSAGMIGKARGAVAVGEDEATFAAAVVGLLKSPERQAELREAALIDAQAWSAREMALRLVEFYSTVQYRVASGA